MHRVCPHGDQPCGRWKWLGSTCGSRRTVRSADPSCRCATASRRAGTVAPPEPALTDAGYHAVAPDMRGYGGTDAPADPPPSRSSHALGTRRPHRRARRERGEDRRTRLGQPGRRTAALQRPDHFWLSSASPCVAPRAALATRVLLRIDLCRSVVLPRTSRSRESRRNSTRNRRGVPTGFVCRPAATLTSRCAGPVGRSDSSAMMLDHLLQPEVLPDWLTCARSRLRRGRVHTHGASRWVVVVLECRRDLGAHPGLRRSPHPPTGALRRR